MIGIAPARPLPWFMLLSFGLHLLFFASLGISASVIATRYLGEPLLRVQLQDSVREQVLLPPKKIRSDPPSKRNHIGSILTSPTTQHASNALPTSSHVQAAASQQNPKSAVATEAVRRNQLLGELQTNLSQFLVYPPLARRRGWEGTVLLGLRVKRNGYLDEIHIEHSSGYAVLDHSALNSLIRLGHLAEVSSYLNGHGMDMQLPVIYQLIEN